MTTNQVAERLKTTPEAVGRFMSRNNISDIDQRNLEAILVAYATPRGNRNPETVAAAAAWLHTEYAGYPAPSEESSTLNTAATQNTVAAAKTPRPKKTDFGRVLIQVLAIAGYILTGMYMANETAALVAYYVPKSSLYTRYGFPFVLEFAGFALALAMSRSGFSNTVIVMLLLSYSAWTFACNWLYWSKAMAVKDTAFVLLVSTFMFVTHFGMSKVCVSIADKN
jgi:hypothetical protein